jgi:hypothetical protein
MTRDTIAAAAFRIRRGIASRGRDALFAEEISPVDKCQEISEGEAAVSLSSVACTMLCGSRARMKEKAARYVKSPFRDPAVSFDLCRAIARKEKISASSLKIPSSHNRTPLWERRTTNRSLDVCKSAFPCAERQAEAC